MGALYISSLKNSIDFSQYSKIIVFFSGGKDSVACVLSLLDAGVDPSILELHHHLIDGDNAEFFMDWPVTESYCKAFGQAFNIPVFFSWRVGGFERELLRENDFTGNRVYPDATGKMIEVEGLRNPKFNNSITEIPIVFSGWVVHL